METDGIAVDTDHLDALHAEFTERMLGAAQEAYDVIGKEVNLGSPKQLQVVLFEELDMPKTKRTKTGYTTDADALQALFDKTEHPFLQHLLAHRDVTRLRQTVEGLQKTVAPDGRIHTTYFQTIAATGRLSSADPNLQNIPIRTESGRRIREAFTVGDGFETLLTADYSQIEMRIMAHLSEDADLIEAFRSGHDFHTVMAAKVFEREPDDIDGGLRARIKAMNYGLAYGLSSYGLSQQLGIGTSEAQALMDDYFETFGGVRDYLRGLVDEARQHRLHRHDPRPAPLPARPAERQPPAPRDGRAHGAQRADPGIGGRHHQGGDARASSGRSARRSWRPACSCRCTTSWCSRSPPGSGSARAAGPRADGRRGRPLGAARRVSRRRPHLARSRSLTLDVDPATIGANTNTTARARQPRR